MDKRTQRIFSRLWTFSCSTLFRGPNVPLGRLTVTAARLGLLALIGIAGQARAIVWHESTITMNASITGGMALTNATESFFEHTVYQDSVAVQHARNYIVYLGSGRSLLNAILWLEPMYAGLANWKHIAMGSSWIYRNDINGDNQAPFDETFHRFQVRNRTETVFSTNGGEATVLVNTDEWTTWNECKLEKGIYFAGSFVPTSVIDDHLLPYYTQYMLAPGTYRFSADVSYDTTENSVWYRSMGANLTILESMNQPPVAIDDYYAVDQLHTLNQSGPGILVNDTDPDNNALSVELVGGPSHASAFHLNPDGSFSYTPVGFFYGEDTFTYRVFDGTAYSAVATVHITVRKPGSQGFITGGGNYFQNGTKRTFGLDAKVKSNGTVQGNLEFQDHALGLNVKSINVTWVYSPNPQDGYFSGACNMNGQAGYTYFVEVHDRGEPGTNDSFSVWVFDASGTQVYTSGGGLTTGGNIQIH